MIPISLKCVLININVDCMCFNITNHLKMTHVIITLYVKSDIINPLKMIQIIFYAP